ncbi:hypothetical protein BDN70DRAFT_869769 [Pholiota conissans]|uniref:Conserved oligomeric Golgi complex subunit 1 n=1 Tax=Pholiota conissans TaxID=109636 RepID=A0A9P6D841_9AGAR|nr:hypothetical protein BDN70DRAFT_869769 [Pholiota conissans]
MAVSPTYSARSFLSSKSGAHTAADSALKTPAISSGSSATLTKSLPIAKLPPEELNLSPDELFSKYTVSEVRAVEHRLRADANAKQEELRLMVGERYRDLLQASSAIISIAKSSQRVLDALEESKEAIISQHDLPLPPKTASIDGLDDRHLVSLQVLSAHMKLLLDAPEHLWRLIERKQYFQAAWLFLLSRVVHRALVHQDENDEQSWVSEGVDVLTEFPLVQRQWDVVSQFRSQIIHKSTLSLRDASVSSEEICATLVTLHLLDSRPLTETVETFFTQRSKTLHTILERNSNDSISKQNRSSSFANGNGHHVSSTKSTSAREVTQLMKRALGVIVQTVITAREIFKDESSNSSLIVRVLRSIQDQSETSSSRDTLPAELYLTTQSLLTHLTSSANFQLLPPNLRSYKPYIDLSSSSSLLEHAGLSQRVEEWFKGSCDQWRHSAAQWFSGLLFIKEVWSLRNLIRRYISSSGLLKGENAYILSDLDSLCHDRIIGIWQKLLLNTETKFRAALHDNISVSLQAEGVKDTPPLDFIFQPPPIPVLTQILKSFADTPFQKYQLSLKQQLVGRSTHLHAVLSTLEQCARTIQQDFLHLKANGDDKTMPFIERLTKSYQPTATLLTVRVTSALKSESVDANKNVASAPGFTFLCRIMDDLASSSSFISNIGCTKAAIQEFKRELSVVNQNVLEKWRENTVNRIIQDCTAQIRYTSRATDPIGISAPMLHGLLNLCDSIRQLGIIYHPVNQHTIVQKILRTFIATWASKFWDEKIEDAALHDIAFIRNLAERYGELWEDIVAGLSKKLKTAISDEAALSELEISVAEYFARTQTLFAILLPAPLNPVYDVPLLRFGTPTTQGQQSAIDLAKPSPRFGMLLTGNAER